MLPALPFTPSARQWGLVALVLAAASLSACTRDAPPKPGQALVSVNGEEITALQLNEELQRANVQAAQQEAASKQLLEALIDRQLLRNQAANDRTDRDPKVVQAIERAKAMIIAQAYMQKKIGTVTRPTAADVADYYARHPDFFAGRKQFDMKQLVIDTKDLTEQVKLVADKASSLDDVATWFDANQVKYVRNQSTRTGSDLTPELSGKLKRIAKGKLFVVKEGPRSMLVSIADMKDSPVSLEIAAPQIEKFLLSKRTKDAADAELARLRTLAKIDYLNKPAGVGAASAAGSATAATSTISATPASAPVPAPAVATAGAKPAVPAPAVAPDAAAAARGVAGLK